MRSTGSCPRAERRRGAVIAGIAGDDFPALGLPLRHRVLPGELDRGLGRLRAARHEEGALEPGPGKVGEEAAGFVHQKLDFDFRVFRVQRGTGNQLDATIRRIRPRLDVHGARWHSVAATAALSWPSTSGRTCQP